MDKISTGEWPVGHMISTELQLCEQFGVSRPTVRTAVLKLVQEGHLRRVKGKGTFVTAPKVLEQATVFIENFLRGMHQRGIEISTEVLEFQIMPAEPKIMERLEPDSKEMIKLSRLRYVRDSFDQNPIVLSTSWFTEEERYLLNYDFDRLSLTEVLGDTGKHRKHMEKALTSAAELQGEPLAWHAGGCAGHANHFPVPRSGWAVDGVLRELISVGVKPVCVEVAVVKTEK